MRQSVDGLALGVMSVMCLLWGLQQVVMKAASADVSTLLQVTLRSGISAIFVWIFSRFIAREPWLKGLVWGPGLLVASLFAGEFWLLAEGLRWTSASHMVVFLYTAPIFAAVGLHLRLPEERLSWIQWGGIALAFSGIVMTFFDHAQPDTPTSSQQLWGDLLGVGAGFLWGMTTVAIRVSRLSEAPATQTLFYQLFGGFFLLLPLVFLTDQFRWAGTWLAWSSVGFQALVISFMSYLIWFRLLRRYRAAQLGVLSFMTPLWGVVLGALLLKERLAPSFLLGAGLVFVGVLLVNAEAVLKMLRRLTSVCLMKRESLPSRQ